MSRQKDTPMSFVFEELEPRIMYSADFAPGLADDAGWMPQAEVRLLGDNNHVDASALSPDLTARTREIFFVDAGVQDYQQLIDDVQRARGTQHAVEVVVLDAARDGVEQITELLGARSDISTVHIISHGSDGALQLGNASLSADTLPQYRNALTQWGGALSADADILLYGCDVAADATGQAFVRQIAQITGADVAASTDNTGDTALGGDWDLEYQLGAIEAPLALSQQAQHEWFGELNIAALPSVKDTYIVSATGSNYGASSNLILDESGGGLSNGHVLLQFDLSAIPAGATINSATLQIQATAVTGSTIINVYQVTQAWDEGAANGTSGAANWNQRIVGTNWTTAGGTIDATVLASIAPPLAAGQQNWTNPLLTALVQNWYTGTTPNNGVMLASTDTGTDTVTYNSREGATAPTLVIDYTLSSVAPILSLPGGVVNFTEGGAPLVIDAGATVNDVDSPDFAAGALTVNLTANGSVDDRLSINNQGAGAGQIGVSGSNVTYEGIVIGALTGGTNGLTPLVVTFNASADATAVQALARNITYQNIAVDPSTLTRTVSFALTDGDGGTSVAATKTISVIPDNILVVTTAADTQDGSVTSISALLASRGADGQISLREAILATNNTANVNASTPDQIAFNVAGAGSHTITLTYDGPDAGTAVDALPIISDVVSIDGTTQPGFAGTPMIRIDGNGVNADGLTLGAGSDGSTVKGLIITRFDQDGIEVSSDGNLIIGNYVGTDGAVDLGNKSVGVNITGANNLVGGTTAATRNVVSGNDFAGVAIAGATATGNSVQGNWIGLAADGLAAIGNGSTIFSITYGNGVWIQNGATGNVIGGTALAERNVISGNLDDGVEISNAPGNRIYGNWIGLSAAGTVTVGNGDAGVYIDNSAGNFIGGANAGEANVIGGNNVGVGLSGSNAKSNIIQGNYIGTNAAQSADFGNDNGILIKSFLEFGGSNGDPSDNTIGGVNLGEGNVIAFSANDGVLIANGTGNAVRGNSIYGNAGLGIDLGTTGMTDNDAGDPDTGANNLQNFPVLTAAITNGAQITIGGSINTNANVSGIVIDFYATATSQLSGAADREGARYLGSTTVNTNGSGDATFTNVALTASVAAGEIITATTTTPGANGNTSEFSAGIAAVNNSAPTTSGIANVTENEDALPSVIDLFAIFGDAQDADSALSYAITANTNPALVASTSINAVAGTLTLNYAANQSGASNITVRATDTGGLFVETTFTVTVNAVNDAPTQTSNTGASVSEGASVTITSGRLSASDADNTPAQLTYSVGTLPSNGALRLNGTALAVNGTFTQADINAGLVTYLHNGSETTADAFTFTVSDGAGGTIGATSFAITVTPVNDAPALATNTGLALSEGASATITNARLSVSDVDNTPAQLSYTVSAIPANGALRLNGTALAVNGTFTQDDINNNRVTYLHNGSETAADTFTFTVSDGAGGTIGATSFAITVTPVNDAPALATNTGLTLSEGASATITNARLSVSDVDNTPAQLSYTVSTIPANGALRLNGTALAVNGTFTQADINAGLVTYLHNGSETTSDSFTFTVSDGAGGAIGATSVAVTVNAVNDAPALTTNTGASVNEGASVTITNARLSTSDVDSTPAQLTYTVSSIPVNGSVRLNGTALAVNGTFTQADINAGLVTYLHNGSETTNDSFNFTVSDGAGGAVGAPSFAFTVNAVNDTPTLVTNTGATVNEGAITTVTNTWLQTSDVDNIPLQLVYSMGTVPVNGALRLNGAALGVNGTFTQEDINNSRVTYLHDGSETSSDSFTFTVSDGAGGMIGASTFALNVTAVNDTPVLSLNTTANVNEGASVTIDSARLLANDLDNMHAQLTYTVIALPVNGALQLNGVALSVNGTFTQEDVNNNRVSYLHNGSETSSDGFSFALSDGAGGAIGTTNFALTVSPVNDNSPAITSNGAGVNAAVNVAENSSAVTIVTATDADLPAQTLAYAIIGGADQALFSIDSVSGALSFSAVPDFEVRADANRDNVYEVTVQASDGLGGVDAQTISVLVTNINETGVSAVIDSDPSADSVSENSTAGTGASIVVAATDSDAGDTISYSLDNDAGGRFAIDSATGVVSVAGALDYESGSSHNILVRATSTDGSFNTRSFSISVLDQNDNAPVIGAGQVLSIAEHSGNGTSLGVVAAIDADSVGLMQNWTVTGGSGASAFAINAVTGEITVADASQLNFEVNPSFTLQLSVADGVNTAIAQTLTISLTDVNETPQNNAPGAQSFTEDVAAFLAGVSVNDVDANLSSVQLTVANGSVSVSVAGGAAISAGTNGSNSLTLTGTQTQINLALGSIVYQSTLNFDGVDTLVIVSTDANGLSDTDAVVLNIAAVNDAPHISTNALSLSEGETLTLSATNLSALDPEQSAAQLRYSVANVTGGRFELRDAAGVAITSFTQADIDTGRVLFVHDGDESAPGYEVTVSDAAAVDGPSIASITFNNVNDAPALNAARGANLGEASSLLIDVANLRVTDADNAAAQLLYTVTTTPSNGQLEFIDNPGVVIASFTQADIDAGRVHYVRLGSAGGDSFAFLVSDGGAAPIVAIFTIHAGENVDTSTFAPSPKTSQISQQVLAEIHPEEFEPPQRSTAESVPPTTPGHIAPIVQQASAPIVVALASDETAQSAALADRPALPSGRRALAAPVAVSLRAAPTAIVQPDNVKLGALDSSSTTISREAPLLRDTRYTRQLDQARERASKELDMDKVAIGSSIAASTGLSIGYVLWLLRGGVLVSGLLSSLPAWRMIDPLPVLGRIKEEDAEDEEESLQSLVKHHWRAPPTEPAAGAFAPASDAARLIEQMS